MAPLQFPGSDSMQLERNQVVHVYYIECNMRLAGNAPNYFLSLDFRDHFPRHIGSGPAHSKIQRSGLPRQSWSDRWTALQYLLQQYDLIKKLQWAMAIKEDGNKWPILFPGGLHQSCSTEFTSDALFADLSDGRGTTAPATAIIINTIQKTEKSTPSPEG